MARIVVVKGVSQYRRTIPSLVAAGDVVLEVGCAEGTTSALLHERCATLVAIDKGESIRAARERHSHIRFEQLDGFDINALKRLGCAFNKVYLDISGSAPVQSVLKMILNYESAFGPELIVVKHHALRDFLGRCELWEADRT